MEVDPSIRTNQVNYSNRPQYKGTRNFNIESNPQTEEDEDVNQYFENFPYLTMEYHPEGKTFERYSQEVEYQEDSTCIQENLDQAELNFLE